MTQQRLTIVEYRSQQQTARRHKPPVDVLENALAQQIALTALPAPTRNFRFDARAVKRRWKFDFAWSGIKLAVEVEGVVNHESGKGRHQTVAGYSGDCEKYNEALLQGWRVLRVTKLQIKSGQALAWIEQALKGERS